MNEKLTIRIMNNDLITEYLLINNTSLVNTIILNSKNSYILNIVVSVYRY